LSVKNCTDISWKNVVIFEHFWKSVAYITHVPVGSPFQISKYTTWPGIISN